MMLKHLGDPLHTLMSKTDMKCVLIALLRHNVTEILLLATISNAVTDHPSLSHTFIKKALAYHAIIKVYYHKKPSRCLPSEGRNCLLLWYTRLKEVFCQVTVTEWKLIDLWYI